MSIVFIMIAITVGMSLGAIIWYSIKWRTNTVIKNRYDKTINQFDNINSNLEIKLNEEVKQILDEEKKNIENKFVSNLNEERKKYNLEMEDLKKNTESEYEKNISKIKSQIVLLDHVVKYLKLKDRNMRMVNIPYRKKPPVSQYDKFLHKFIQKMNSPNYIVKVLEKNTISENQNMTSDFNSMLKTYAHATPTDGITASYDTPYENLHNIANYLSKSIEYSNKIIELKSRLKEEHEKIEVEYKNKIKILESDLIKEKESKITDLENRCTNDKDLANQRLDALKIEFDNINNQIKNTQEG